MRCAWSRTRSRNRTRTRNRNWARNKNMKRNMIWNRNRDRNRNHIHSAALQSIPILAYNPSAITFTPQPYNSLMFIWLQKLKI